MSVNENDPVVGQICQPLSKEVAIQNAIGPALEVLKAQMREYGICMVNLACGVHYDITNIASRDGEVYATIEPLHDNCPELIDL